MESTALPVLTIGAAILSAFYLGQSSGLMHDGQPTGGLFGTAVATMGMLSTAVYVLAMDVFGPIADNAGGIDKLSFLLRSFLIQPAKSFVTRQGLLRWTRGQTQASVG